jgi:hypothetical protein
MNSMPWRPIDWLSVTSSSHSAAASAHAASCHCSRQRREAVLHALQRPAQVHRGRPGGQQAGAGRFQAAFGSLLGQGQCDAVGCGRANQGRAANAHDRDGFGRVLECVQGAEFQTMRQHCLVDDFDAAVAGQRADGSGGRAVNVHVQINWAVER